MLVLYSYMVRKSRASPLQLNGQKNARPTHPEQFLSEVSTSMLMVITNILIISKVQTFVISGPSTVSDAALASNNLGDCTTDTFVISGQGGGSPVICGTNTGQHCKNLTF